MTFPGSFESYILHTLLNIPPLNLNSKIYTDLGGGGEGEGGCINQINATGLEL